MKLHAMLLGGLAALPAFALAQSDAPAHTHDTPRSPQVEAALAKAKAAVPAPRWHAIRETRVAAGRKSADTYTVVELDSALNQAVLVVLDENGTPHSECVESAPPQAQR